MPDTNEEPKTFTQEDLNRIAAEQKARGEREAQKAFEEKLGGKSLDDLLAAHQALTEAEEARKSETQKALEAAQAEKAAAEQAKAEAVTELHQARITAALLKAGAPEDAIGTINVPVEIGADAETITEAVQALKTKLPALFTTTAAPSANPGTPTPKRESTEFGSGGLEEFRNRFPNAS